MANGDGGGRRHSAQSVTEVAAAGVLRMALRWLRVCLDMLPGRSGEDPSARTEKKMDELLYY